jgi:hypothetical protein
MSLSTLIFAALILFVQSSDERWPPTHDIPESDAHAALAENGASYSDAQGWQQRAAQIHNHLAKTLNLAEKPWSGPVAATRHSRREMDGYSVENVQLETMPGFFVGANLYTPLDREGPFPVVLAPHGHKRADDSGAEGRFQPNYQKLCGTLARAGAVVLTWDMVGWGETLWVTHRRPESTSLQTYNTIRAIDFVQSLPEVDPQRIGITGSSGGGTQTFLATALDPRITAAAPTVMVSAHFFGGCSCESGLPIHDDGANLKTSNVEIAALAAPRPLLLISVGGDWTKNTPEIEFPYVQRIYELLGVPENAANAHFAEEDHNYGPSKRAASLRFMAKHLGLDLAHVTNLDGTVDDEPVVILPREELIAFTEEFPLPTDAIQDDETAWNTFLSLPRPSK